MITNKKLPNNQITVYQAPDGKINIEVLYANENIWLLQKRIAKLFDVDRSVVTKHPKNIFSDNELQEDSVCASFAHTAEDGKEYQTQLYNELRWDYSFPRAVCRSLSDLFTSYLDLYFSSQRKEGQIIFHDN